MRSMTGFGRARTSSPLGQIVVEIQSVNRRHLDVKVFLPKELSHLEHAVVDWVSQAASRGQITVKIRWTYGDRLPVGVQANLPFVRQIREAAQQIAKEGGGLDENELTLRLLTHIHGVITLEQEEGEDAEWREELKKTVQESLIPYIASKEKEGSVLGKEFAMRLEVMEQYVKEVEKQAPASVEKQREKLQTKLAELHLEIEHDERILREICLYADKIDITEEISRLKAHIIHYRELIQEGGNGKNLEFVLQEMGREVNTMGSKAVDIAIIQAVLAIKGEIEKMKEQVQNVE